MRQDWSTVAPGWRKWKSQQGVQTHRATEIIVQAARLKPGMHVLDLASGTGDPALTIAEAVGPDGRITATDLVPEMLLVAEESARERGLTNISFQQADAEALPFPDQSFDAITCRFGVMFFPNVQQSLREIRRVLKPGGYAAFVAFGPAEQNPFFRIPQEILKKYGQIPPPEPGVPNPFNFAQAGALSTTMREAGFKRVQEGYRTIPWPWPGPAEQCWEHQIEARPPVRRLVERLAPEQRDQVEAEVIEAIRQYYDGKQVNFTATIVVASGVR
jgi:ubiquinone/menaquinone biosynthesis C-methylase UbiE